MAADRMKGVVQKGDSYYARVSIPKDVSHAFGGITQKWEALGTSNPFDAAKLAPPVIAAIKRKIADVRAGRPVTETTVADARNALAASRAAWVQPKPGSMMTADDAHWVARLEGAVASIDGWRDIPGFDELVAKVISPDQPVDPAAPIVASMRQEVASHLLAQATQLPPSNAARAILVAAQQGREGTVPQPLPAGSIRLRALYDKWKATLSVAEKEKGRLDHQIRRLIEAVGDKPANHLTRDEVREYIDLVGRFPGRSRSVELSALPIRELVEKFEADKAAAKMDPKAGTLTSKTVFEWFSSYRRMFDWAIEERMIELNPFEGKRLQEFAASKGGAGVKKRHFTGAEIKSIFSAPMFTGFDGDGLRGYRDTVGTTIVRDSKYWIPILALYHGNRLTEFAALPVADLCQSPAGSWYFDLTDRKVKNESSQRHIPLHPKLVELGFLKYVETIRKGNSPWLFPDLDHENKNGPGHEFSKWWGRWMHKRGLTDPTISLHSWRHTWKRRARETPDMKKELHDVLTGHATTTVSDEYGKGADIEPLVREMAKMVFPEFPALPVLAA